MYISGFAGADKEVFSSFLQQFISSSIIFVPLVDWIFPTIYRVGRELHLTIF